MCYDEGMLQAYLDRELPGRKRWEMEVHVAQCERCKQILANLEAANNAVGKEISDLADNLGEVRPDVDKAWTYLTQDPCFSKHSEIVSKKGVYAMQNRLRMVLIPIAAVAAIAIALSFAPVRGLATDLLNIFRVQNIETITVSQDDLKQLEKLGSTEGGKVDIDNFGSVETTGMSKPEKMTLAEAQKLVDFQIKLPDTVAGYGAPSIEVQKGTSSSFKLNVASANEVIKTFGGNALLPQELDGKTFTVTMPTVVVATYTNAAGQSFMVGQARSPEFALPDGTSPEQVRDVLLNMPMLPENIRNQIAAIKDWKNTLVIPNINGSAQDTTIAGVDGVLISPPKDMPKHYDENVTPSDQQAFIWQADGVVHGIGGALNQDGIATVLEAMK